MLHLRFITDGTPDAPLLLIYGRDRAVAARLADCMKRLAIREISMTRLSMVQGIVSVDGADVTMVAGLSDEGVLRKCLNEFVWSLTPQSWEDMAELLAPFTLEDVPDGAHQRLVPHVRLPGAAIPVIITTSAEGQW